MADGSEIAERYENQRRVRGKFGSLQLLPSDPPAWSDAQGRPSNFLPPRWTWSDATWVEDAAGWRYGITWADLFSSTQGAKLPTDRHCVRRRRFTRRRIPAAASNPRQPPPLPPRPVDATNLVEVAVRGVSYLFPGNGSVAWLQEEVAAAFLRQHTFSTHICQVLGLWLQAPDGSPVPGPPLDPGTTLRSLSRGGAAAPRQRLWARLQVAVTLPPCPVIGIYLDARQDCLCPVVRRLLPASEAAAASAAAASKQGSGSSQGRRGSASKSQSPPPPRKRSGGALSPCVLEQRSDAVVAGMRLLRVDVRRGSGSGTGGSSGSGDSQDMALDLSALPPRQAARALQDLAHLEKSLVLADPAPAAAGSGGSGHGGVAGSARTLPYRLSVTVVAAKGLRRADLLSSDPFVCLRLAGSSRRTRVVYNTTSPTWQETFSYPLLSRDCNLVAEVWDYDSVKEDDPLGEVVLNLGDLATFPVNPPAAAGVGRLAVVAAPHREHDGWWTVTPGLDKKGGGGQLHLKIRIDQEFHLSILPRQQNVAAMMLQRAIRAFLARRVAGAAAAAAPQPYSSGGTVAALPAALAAVVGGIKTGSGAATSSATAHSGGASGGCGMVDAARPPLMLTDIFPPSHSRHRSGGAASMAAAAAEGEQRLSAVTLAFLGGPAREGPFSGAADAARAAESLAHDVRIDLENKLAAAHALGEGLMQDSTALRYPLGGSNGSLVPRRLNFHAADEAPRGPNEAVATLRCGALTTRVAHSTTVLPQSEELLGGQVMPVLVPPMCSPGEAAAAADVASDGSVTLKYADGIAYRITPGDEYSYWRLLAALAFAGMDPSSQPPKKRRRKGCGSGVLELTDEEEEEEGGELLFNGEVACIGSFGRVQCSIAASSTLLRWSDRPTAPLLALDVAAASSMELSHDNPPAARHVFTMTLIGGDFTGHHAAAPGRRAMQPYCKLTVGSDMRTTRVVGGSRPFWNTHFSWAVSDRDLDGGGVRISAFGRRLAHTDDRLGEVVLPFAQLSPGIEYVETVPLVAGGTRRLRLLLRDAKGLPIADARGTSDPYCVMVPVRRDGTKVEDERQVSATRSKTLDPSWEQSFDFGKTVPVDELEGIEVTIFDHDLGRSDDVLGKFFCRAADFGDPGAPPTQLSLEVQAVAEMKHKKFSMYARARGKNLNSLGTVRVGLGVISKEAAAGAANAATSGTVKIRCKLQPVDAFCAAYPALVLPHAAEDPAGLLGAADRKVEPTFVSCGFGSLILRPEPPGAVAIDLAAFVCNAGGSENGHGSGVEGAAFVEVWEHQRHHTVFGWGSDRRRHLSRADPAKFTDVTGVQALPVKKLEDVAPLPGWQWAGNWALAGEWFHGNGAFHTLAAAQDTAPQGSAGKGNLRRRPWRRELRPASGGSARQMVSPAANAATADTTADLEAAPFPAALLPFCAPAAGAGGGGGSGGGGGGSGNAGSMLLEVFENQRHQAAAGWGSSLESHLLGRDPQSKYTDATGAARLDSLQDIVVEAIDGYAPAAQGPLWQAGNWRYATEFSDFADRSFGADAPPVPPRGVRRRCWTCALRKTGDAPMPAQPSRRQSAFGASAAGSDGGASAGGDLAGAEETRLALEGVRRVCALSDGTLLVEWRAPQGAAAAAGPWTAVTLVVGPCPAAELGSLVLERVNVVSARASLSHILQKSVEATAAAVTYAAAGAGGTEPLTLGSAAAAEAAAAAIEPFALEALTTQAGVLLQALQTGIAAYGGAYGTAAGRRDRRMKHGGAAASLARLDAPRRAALARALWGRLVRLHAYARELICVFPRGRLWRADGAGEWGWAAVMSAVHEDMVFERQRLDRRDSGGGADGGGSNGGGSGGGGGTGSGSGGDGPVGVSVALVRSLEKRLGDLVAEYMLSANCTPQEELRTALAVLATAHYLKAVDEVGRHVSHHHAASTMDDKDLLQLLDLLLNAGDLLSPAAAGALALLGWDVGPRPRLSEAVGTGAILSSYAGRVEQRLGGFFANILAGATDLREPPSPAGGTGNSTTGNSTSGGHFRRSSGDSAGTSRTGFEGAPVALLLLLDPDNANGMPISSLVPDTMSVFDRYIRAVAAKFRMAYAVHALVLRAGANALSGLRNTLDGWAQRVYLAPAWLPLSDKLTFLCAVANDSWNLVTAALPDLESSFPGGVAAGAAEPLEVAKQLWLALGQSCIRRVASLLLDEVADASPAASPPALPTSTKAFREHCRAVRNVTARVCPMLEPYWGDKLLASLCDSVTVSLAEGLLPRAAARKPLDANELEQLQGCRNAIYETFEELDDAESGSGLWRNKLAFLDDLLELLTTPPAQALATYKGLLVRHPGCQQSLAHALEAMLRLRSDAAQMPDELNAWADPQNWIAADGNGFESAAAPSSDPQATEPFRRLFWRPVSEQGGNAAADASAGNPSRKRSSLRRSILGGGGGASAGAEAVAATEEGSEPPGAVVQLSVEVREAEGLTNKARVFGKVDPYCVLTLSSSSGTMRKKTRTRTNTLEPKWQETLTFEAPSLTEAQLMVDVMASRTVGSDEPLGRLEVPLGGFDAPPSPGISAERGAMGEPNQSLEGRRDDHAKWYEIEGGGRLHLRISVARVAEEVLV